MKSVHLNIKSIRLENFVIFYLNIIFLLEDFTVQPKPEIKSMTLLPAAPATSNTAISSKDKSTINDNNDDPARAAFEHIRKIREGFGVDSTLDAAGQSIVSNLQGLITRSLEKLSIDLFSEQGHFVLELIQNADDNQYAPDCVPTLRFILSSERILVYNNEIGFQPHHISAICDVGKSTKGKHKQGYAGHKGNRSILRRKHLQTNISNLNTK